MKKIYVMAMAVVAFSFTACTGGNSNNEATEEVPAVVEEKVDQNLVDLVGELSAGVEANDEDGVRGTIDAFRAQIQALINAGNMETAQKYAAALKDYVDNNVADLEGVSKDVAENAQMTVADLVSKAANLPNEVVETAKDAAQNVANEAKSAAEAKVNDAKDAAEAKANEAIENQKKKANEAIDKAAQDAKKALGL